MKKVVLSILLIFASFSLFSQTSEKKESPRGLTAFPSSLVKSYELVRKDSTNRLLVTFENGYSVMLPCTKNVNGTKPKVVKKHVRRKGY